MPMAPSAPLPTKLAIAEKHMAHALLCEDYAYHRKTLSIFALNALVEMPAPAGRGHSTVWRLRHRREPRATPPALCARCPSAQNVNARRASLIGRTARPGRDHGWSGLL